MQRLNKIYDKYISEKDFHENEGFNAYVNKESEINKKRPLPYSSHKVYYGGASCHYEVVINLPPVSNSNIANRFNELAAKWEDETGLYSTITPKVVNDTFYDLLLLGKEDIIPLILKRLQHGGLAQWHIVLNAITKANPVSPDDITKSKKIKESWISWGKENRYIQ